jgi:hypothetical protein
VALVCERTISTGRPPLFGEVSANFCGLRECRVVCVTDPYGRILGFLYRSRYVLFQVAPQLYSHGWVDLVPDPLLLGKSGSAANRTRDLWHCSQDLWPPDHRGGPNPMYGRANANGRRVACLYVETFPHRRHPNHKTFVAIDRRLRGTGTLKPFAVNCESAGSVQTPDVEKRVCSGPRCTRQLTVWRVLYE